MPASAGNGQNWTVNSQTPRLGLDSKGRYVQGYQIDFTTAGGFEGQVFVPLQGFSAAAAIEAIRQHVQQLEAIGSSGG